MSTHLGDFEQLLMLALVHLGDGAYGPLILEQIARRTGREVSLGAIYKTLDRLAAKGYVRSWMGEPTAVRGGRRKRHYAIEGAGRRALESALSDLRSMTHDLSSEWPKP